MSSIERAELALSYRKHAVKCVLIAKRLESTSERLVLIDMAEEWIALAQQAEKNPEGLERLELMLLIEDEFADLEIPEGVAHRVENVGDALRYVELAIMERRGSDSLQNGELGLGRSAA